MASQAVIGYGTLLRLGDGGSPEVFTTVAEVMSISGPSITNDEIEVTHMQSPNRFREFIKGLKDPGEVSFDINLVPSNATQDESTGLLALANSGDTVNWKLVFPATPAFTASFSAFVKSFEFSAEIDAQLKASVSLRIAGAISFA